jgi:hypothetical protein
MELKGYAARELRKKRSVFECGGFSMKSTPLKVAMTVQLWLVPQEMLQTCKVRSKTVNSGLVRCFSLTVEIG